MDTVATFSRTGSGTACHSGRDLAPLPSRVPRRVSSPAFARPIGSSTRGPSPCLMPAGAHGRRRRFRSRPAGPGPGRPEAPNRESGRPLLHRLLPPPCAPAGGEKPQPRRRQPHGAGAEDRDEVRDGWRCARDGHGPMINAAGSGVGIEAR
jgi:hypothetical protein